jgi:hypothetical protein
MPRLEYFITIINTFFEKVIAAVEIFFFNLFCRHHEVHRLLKKLNFDQILIDYNRVSKSEFFLIYPELNDILFFFNLSQDNFSLETVFFFQRFTG